VPAGKPRLTLEIGHLPNRPWRLQVFADDDSLASQTIGADDSHASNSLPVWKEVTLDLSPYAGHTITLRLYQWLVGNEVPGAAYWRTIHVD
jgi:hypothetical protein